MPVRVILVDIRGCKREEADRVVTEQPEQRPDIVLKTELMTKRRKQDEKAFFMSDIKIKGKG